MRSDWLAASALGRRLFIVGRFFSLLIVGRSLFGALRFGKGDDFLRLRSFFDMLLFLDNVVLGLDRLFSFAADMGLDRFFCVAVDFGVDRFFCLVGLIVAVLSCGWVVLLADSFFSVVVWNFLVF